MPVHDRLYISATGRGNGTSELCSEFASDAVKEFFLSQEPSMGELVWARSDVSSDGTSRPFMKQEVGRCTKHAAVMLEVWRLTTKNSIYMDVLVT